MKTSIINAFVLSTIVGLATGCSTSNSDPTPAAVVPACKIIKSVYTAFTPPNLSVASITNTSTYTYEGELLKTKVDNYVSTGSNPVTNTINYTYNSAGYVTTEVINSTSAGTTTTNNYNYTNNRLTSVTSGSTTIRSYDYDGNGNLIKFSTPSTSSTYSGGVLTGITSTSAYPAYTVQNGRVTKVENSASVRTEYEYDTQGRVSEFRMYSNNILSTKTVSEYAPNVPPNPSASPRFLGTPVVPYNYGIVAYKSKDTQYNGTGAVTSTTNYVNAFNAKGHPTSIVLNSNFTQGTVYEYQDCN